MLGGSVGVGVNVGVAVGISVGPTVGVGVDVAGAPPQVNDNGAEKADQILQFVQTEYAYCA